MEATPTKVLCVDDEPAVLEGLTLTLGRRYALSTATSGVEALRTLQGMPDVAVVVSDMRMPGMNGAAFLAAARQIVPDAVRVLLTGQADIDSAVAAINDGQVFRFLTKPCPPPKLISVLVAAVEQHRLLTAERVLLEQTLKGCLQALMDTFALANPVCFGRALRLRQMVSELATHLGVRHVWQAEVAAMLSQLGYIALPPETAEKLYLGRALANDERQSLDEAPAIARQLLSGIPRMDDIQNILATYTRPYSVDAGSMDSASGQVRRAAQLLRVTMDFDVLEAQSQPDKAVAIMRSRNGCYAPDVLAALEAILKKRANGGEVQSVTLAALRAGMVIADDLRLAGGTLLTVRGFTVTESFIARLRRYHTGAVKEPIRVIAPRAVA